MTGKNARIGIFPGAFDPIHEGHIAFACAVGKQLNLDKIFFLVEPRPRRKQGVRALEHRIAMTQAAIKNDHHLGIIMLEEARFEVDSAWPKISARFANAELYMIMGEGNMAHIVSWPQVDEFVDMAPTFIIGTKSDETRKDLQETLYTLQHTKAFPFVYHFVAMPDAKISSRSIRASLRRGLVPAYLPRPAYSYIRSNGLYSSETGEK